MKLMGAGVLFLGLGAFGISNILKNIREASAITEAAPLNNKIICNDMNKINCLDIRPFHVNVPEAELTELRRRINVTKWPEGETVTDQSQGVRIGPISNQIQFKTIYLR